MARRKRTGRTPRPDKRWAELTDSEADAARMAALLKAQGDSFATGAVDCVVRLCDATAYAIDACDHCPHARPRTTRQKDTHHGK